MALARQIEILPRHAAKAGATLFSSPQPSHETLIAEVSSSANSELFCHRRQTDQLMVLRGAIELVVLEAGVLRHGPSDPRDYLPRPIPANLAPAWAALMAT